MLTAQYLQGQRHSYVVAVAVVPLFNSSQLQFRVTAFVPTAVAWSGVAVLQGHGVQILCKSSQKSQCVSAVVVAVCCVTARCHLLWCWCVEAS